MLNTALKFSELKKNLHGSTSSYRSLFNTITRVISGDPLFALSTCALLRRPAVMSLQHW
jgi:hypothetical protein